MPYHVARSAECPASRPWAVVKDSDGTIMGCHATRSAAVAQLAALHAAEPGMMSRMSEVVERKTWGGVALKADTDTGTLEALVAITNNRDLQGDVIVPGAFAGQHHDPILVLTDHRASVDSLVGVVEAWEEWLPGDERLPLDLRRAGLGAMWVRARINTEKDAGRALLADARFLGARMKWSIGYEPLDHERGKWGPDALPTRMLKAVSVAEVSHVVFAANPATTTLAASGAKGVDVDLAGSLDQALTARYQTLYEALPDLLAGRWPGLESTWAVIEAVWEDRVLIHVTGWMAGESVDLGRWQVRYALDADGQVVWDEPVEVEVQAIVTPKAVDRVLAEQVADAAGVPVKVVRSRDDGTLVAGLGDGRLVEVVVQSDGTVQVLPELGGLTDQLGKAGRVFARRNVARLRELRRVLDEMLAEVDPDEDDGDDGDDGEKAGPAPDTTAGDVPGEPATAGLSDEFVRAWLGADD